MGAKVANMERDYTLVGAILTDHEERIVRVPAGYFQPFEVVVQLSLMEIDSYELEAGIDANVVLRQLPSLGHRYVTLRGTYLMFDPDALIEDVQKAVRYAMRKCPDRDYLPLVMSVLDSGDRDNYFRGFVFDFLGDWLSECEIDGEAYRFKAAPAQLDRTFGQTIRKTIQAHWDWVATLDED